MTTTHPLNPEKTALIVVDVQNDFCHEQGAFGRMGIPMERIEAAVGRLESFIEEVRRAGVSVIFVRTEHRDSTNSPTWLTRRITLGGERVLPCTEGTWGAEFCRVKPAAGDPVVIKHRYSGFADTDLHLILRSHGITHVLVSGVATNVCVESTARDAFQKDFDVMLVEDCCGAQTVEEHQAALVNIRKFFGEVLRTSDVLARLGGEGSK